MLDAFLKLGSTEYAQMKLGLEPLRQALQVIGHPERHYPAVLIAGTNGKGSVARLVESVLRKAGYRTGLYTSPHLERFQERIVVAGAEVADSILNAALEKLAKQCENQNLLRDLTWFERATLLAFEIFSAEKIDIAVLEVGLGGRLDATNVVEPVVSAIVSIGKDHTEILGDSHFDIAREKAGVMRPGRPVVLGWMALEVRTFLQKAARQMGAIPVCPRAPLAAGDRFSYSNHEDLALSLPGNHQRHNAAVAIEILESLKSQGFVWSEAQLREGLQEAKNPGRLEWACFQERRILLDGAHNEEALRCLVSYVRSLKMEQAPVLVFGMMREKNARSALRLLAPLQPQWIFSETALERSLKMAEFKALADSENIRGEFFVDCHQALKRAHELISASDHGWILATGSLYLVGELRRHLRAWGAVLEAS